MSHGGCERPGRRHLDREELQTAAVEDRTELLQLDSGEVVAQFTMQVSSPEYFDLLMYDDGDMEDVYDIDFEEGEDLEDLFMMLDDMGYSVQPRSVQ